MTTSPTIKGPNVSRREALALLACGALVPSAVAKAAAAATPKKTTMLTKPIPSTHEAPAGHRHGHVADV